MSENSQTATVVAAVIGGAFGLGRTLPTSRRCAQHVWIEIVMKAIQTFFE